jgi:protein TonB
MSAVLLPGGLTLDDTRPAPRRLVAPPSPALSAAAPLRSQLKPPASANRGTGIAVVVGLHIVLGYALTTGLASKAVQAIKKPIEMALLPEVLPPPPPPPPPKVVKIEPVQKVVPPPAYVPPPEVVPVVAPPPPIQVVQATPPKEPVVIAAAPAPVPAPPPPAAPLVVKREISLACPGYEAVLATALEEAIDRVGLKGTVQTLIKIRGTQVVEVATLSGPKEYYKYVQAAVKRMRCTAGGADEVQVSLPVIFS